MVAAAVAAATCVLSGVAVPHASAERSIGGFSAHPATANPDNPATRAYFIHSVQAGSTFTDQVVLVNNGPTPLDLLAYPVDGLTGVTSGVVYANHSDPRRGAGSWIQLETSAVHILPYARVLVGFKADVPANAKPGDHLAGLAFEAAHPPKTGGRFSITEVFRTVIGVEMIATGRAHPQLALSAAKLRALPGTNYPAVVVTMRNSGLKLCKPRLSVWLAGSTRGQWVSRQLDTVLPQSRIPFPFPWPHALKPGLYRTSVVGSGCGHRVRLNTVTSLAGGLMRNRSSVTTGATVTPIAGAGNWWILILVGGAGIGIGAVLSHRARRTLSR